MDFGSEDMIDNWDYAAKAKDQPLIINKNKEFRVIGPKLSADVLKLLTYIMENDTATSSVIAEEFDISAPNASMKLKKLLNLGLVIGSKETAESGGLEYVFSAIK